MYAYLQGLAGGATATPTAPAGPPGQQAFQKLCDSCHPGGGAGLGPSLLELDQETFVEVTREGAGAMPAYTTSRLSDQELEAVYAYLQGLVGGATPTPSAAGPPAIPHPLAGRDQCLGCHGSGSTAFPQVPGDHAGRTEDTCTLCHSPAGAPAPSATATPAATATPTPTAPSAGPPAIPHTLEGRNLCLGCHGSGSPAFPQVPVDHAGRANEACTLCHSPTGVPTPAPTAAPTPTTTPAATATPTPSGAVPPAVPHSLAGRDQCLGCHGSGSTAFPQVPADHAGRTEDTCTLCHSSEG